MAQTKSLNDATSSSMSAQENSDEQAFISKLISLLHGVLSKTEISENEIMEINRLHDQVIDKGLINLDLQKLLVRLHEKIKQDTINEENSIRKSLEIIYDIRNSRSPKIKSYIKSKKSTVFMKLLQQFSLTMPVWFPKNDKLPPLVCGALEPHPSYVVKSGDYVAAYVKQSGENRWIVAETVAFKNEKYKIADIDVNEVKRNFTLEKKFVIPLPQMRVDPIACPDAVFSPNQFVLALFPRTTCFFKAIVKVPPKTNYDGYDVLFADDLNRFTITMNVAQMFVIPYPPWLEK